MTRTLDIPATIEALHKAGVSVAEMSRDPNTRRILEALCIRHGVDAVFKDEPPLKGPP